MRKPPCHVIALFYHFSTMCAGYYDLTLVEVVPIAGSILYYCITINRRVEMVWTNCLRHAKAIGKLEKCRVCGFPEIPIVVPPLKPCQ